MTRNVRTVYPQSEYSGGFVAKGYALALERPRMIDMGGVMH